MATSVARRAEYAEATRRGLLDAARELFAADGYVDVSIDEICRRARVTKGALYHHFKDKRDLFAAVFEEVEREWADELAELVAEERDPLERIQIVGDAFLDACLDPARQRIMLLDGPSVVMWEELRQIDAGRGFGLIATLLTDAMDTGQLEPQPVGPLAHLMLGAMHEASLAIARDKDPVRARKRIGAALNRLVQGLAPR
ncbi:MAG TPA: helix-turn-helix domain-containing protein [Thermoleophilaceae bacterium]|jgi:AcrR family transcriptional regulator|nr:helix-turn-helix domain-containing protein [Thermoleophilaceae bacterium]